MINNIFVEIPNQETYDEYKSEISKDSLVFRPDENKIIANDKEYHFVTQVGTITLIDNNDNRVMETAIIKNRQSSYGYYTNSQLYWLGDWDDSIINVDEI